MRSRNPFIRWVFLLVLPIAGVVILAACGGGGSSPGVSGSTDGTTIFITDTYNHTVRRIQ